MLFAECHLCEVLIMLSVANKPIMLSVINYAECDYAECHYAECRYAECHYAECRYAECRYAECHYAECHYTKCHYAECCYAECHGAMDRACLSWSIRVLQVKKNLLRKMKKKVRRRDEEKIMFQYVNELWANVINFLRREFRNVCI
jgi:hypothetical protein